MNKNYAYFLGWMYSDGCITSDKRCNSKTIKIKIVSSDEDVLECFKDITTWRKSYESNGKYVCIRKANKKLAEELINYGVLERKSYENKNNLHLPKIDDEFMPYFIRGYFDGDGTYYWQNEETYLLNTECVSVSETFIKELSEFLINKGINNIFYTETRSNSGNQIAYKIRIRNKKDVKKFIEYVYADSFDICLKRKYEKVKSFIDNYKSNLDVRKEIYNNLKIKPNEYIDEEVIQRRTKTRLERINNGEINPGMKGKHHSEETKEKMRKARKEKLAQVKQRELLEHLEDNNTTTEIEKSNVNV